QPLPGEEAQPQEERHVGLLGVFGCPGLKVDKGLLEYIGRIGPPLQAAIQAQAHHAAQAFTIMAPNPPQHPRVSAALTDHFNRVVSVAQAHNRVTTPSDNLNTGKMAPLRKSLANRHSQK